MAQPVKKMVKLKVKAKGDCPICLNPFTAVIRQPITCPFCPSSACRGCAQQYLLSTLEDPHCFKCKREWNREFIDTHLTQTFRKGPLKIQRRKILMDRERGKLPAMQVFVEATVTQRKESSRHSEIRRRLYELKKKRDALKIQYATAVRERQQESVLDDIQNLLTPIRTERSALKAQLPLIEAKLSESYQVLNGHAKEVRQFIMKCPAGECRGFLSTAWKCGTCQDFFCSDCHVKKAGHIDENHVCNADAKATASMISKETKPCPKCGVRISKIDGCDQMWCTSCQTTFSWNSGQILMNTVVHNPHYYEYLRKQNNGVVPREAGDVPCGGLPVVWQFTRLVMEQTHLNNAEKTEILDMLRCLNDILYARLPNYPLRQVANANQSADIQYLMNAIDEDAWGTSLERTETTFERKKEIGLILQTFVHIGSEKMAAIQNANRNERIHLMNAVIPDMVTVREYTNKSLWEKGVQMDIVVPQISTTWAYTWARKGEMKGGKVPEAVEDVYKDYKDDQGRTYYFNMRTKHTLWDKPLNFVPNLVAVPEVKVEEATTVPPVETAVATNPAKTRRRYHDDYNETQETIMVELANGELVEMLLSEAMALTT